MASTLSDIAARAVSQYLPKMVDNVFMGNPILGKLMGKRPPLVASTPEEYKRLLEGELDRRLLGKDCLPVVLREDTDATVVRDMDGGTSIRAPLNYAGDEHE